MEDLLETEAIHGIEKHRIQALKRYHIMDTPAERSFDNIARLATLTFDLPIGLISFIDTENVFLKANIGVEQFTKVPRANSICSKAMLNDEVTVLEDIPNADTCFLTDPYLAGEMGFKFYAGSPLVTYDGFRIGTICVLGMEVRQFSEKEKTILQALGRIVMDEIEIRVKTTV